MSNTAILDRLEDIPISTNSKEEIMIPNVCYECNNNLICNVVPTFIGFSKLGIVVTLESCPFYGSPTEQKK